MPAVKTRPRRTAQPETYSGHTSLVGRISRDGISPVLVLTGGTSVRLTGLLRDALPVSKLVTVDGTATWNALTNAALSMAVAAVRPVAGSGRRPFADLARHAGDHFKTGSASAHVSRIRGEE